MTVSRRAFADLVIAAFRAAGETGAIQFDNASFGLELLGPPFRRRQLKYLHSEYVRAPAADKNAIVARFAARRFGNAVQTDDSTLLTDCDVDHDSRSCCGDEDLMWLRCPNCQHVWIECYECDTWHVDLDDPGSTTVGRFGQEHPACPACAAALDGVATAQGLSRYLPSMDQVPERHRRFLHERLRR